MFAFYRFTRGQWSRILTHDPCDPSRSVDLFNPCVHDHDPLTHCQLCSLSTILQRVEGAISRIHIVSDVSSAVSRSQTLSPLQMSTAAVLRIWFQLRSSISIALFVPAYRTSQIIFDTLIQYYIPKHYLAASANPRIAATSGA